MKRMLMVGLNCADWVQFLPKFPVEDSDQRCVAQSWERGGNASNNASVLAALGADVEFFGTLADDHLKQFFKDNMDSYGIKYGNCPVLPSLQAGTSVVICSLETGSRTIIHCKGTLPELVYRQFKENINLENYKWIHFEGRNEREIPQMINDIRAFNDKNSTTKSGENETQENFINVPNYKLRQIPISIEVEKRIETISVLPPLADVVFIGKDYSMMKGAVDCFQAAKMFCAELPKGILVVCPWGEQGASFGIAGQSLDQITKVDAYPPEKIVDSLGAGDTFNAAVIYALSNNFPVEDSVRFGCKVAGAKLGFRGFRQISEIPAAPKNSND